MKPLTGWSMIVAGGLVGLVAGLTFRVSSGVMTADVASSAMAGSAGPASQQAGRVTPGAESSTRSAAGAPRGETIEMILGYKSDLRRLGSLKRFFDSRPIEEFPGLFKELERIAGEPFAMMMLFRSWGERDPQSAANYTLLLQPGPERRSIVGAFARAWARRDMPAAKAWVAERLSGQDRSEAERYIVGLERSRAPAPTKEEVLSMPKGLERKANVEAYYREKAKADPAGALNEAMREEKGQERSNLVANLMIGWSTTDPVAAVRWLIESEQKHPGALVGVGSIPMRLLVEKDPVAGRAMMEAMPPSRARGPMWQAFAGELIKKDRDAAVAFYEHAVREVPEGAFSTFFSIWLQDGSPEAQEAFRNRLIEMSKGRFSIENAANHPMHLWMQKDPLAAAKFAATLPEATQPSLYYAIAPHWARIDAAAALSWAASNSRGPSREHAMRQFAFVCAEHDLTKTTEWLNALPADAGRWAATEGLVFKIIDGDPDAALVWLRTIPDESMRHDILRRAWRKWSVENGTSAQQWMEEAELSEGERQALGR